MKSARKWHLNDIYHPVCLTTGDYFSVKSEFEKRPFVKSEIGTILHCLKKYCTENLL